MTDRPTRTELNPRTHLTVLVTDAGTLGALAAIRSLGRVGYRVVACSSDADALGLRSRYAAAARVHPPYASGHAFRDWFAATVATERPDLVIPSEALLLALRPVLADYAHLLPGAERPERLYRAFSKHDVLAAFAAAGDDALRAHLPESLLDDGTLPLDSLCERAATLGFPLYVKADGVHARHGEPGRVVRVDDATALRSVLAQMRAAYARLTLQAHVPGIGVAAFALFDGDNVAAMFMHRRLHEVPHTGGVSSYRESWDHPRILTDALRRLAHLGVAGPAMVEYRWDPATDRFWFVEVNARLWGSLHLAMAAGVDFPRLHADLRLGLGGPRALPAWRPRRMRQTVPLEVSHLVGVLRDRALPLHRRLASAARFVALGLDPRVHSDLSYPGDRALWWRALFRHACVLTRALLNRRQARIDACPQKA